jgi:hypothetical protein
LREHESAARVSEKTVQILYGLVSERLVVEDAGIVPQHIQPAEALEAASTIICALSGSVMVGGDETDAFGLSH